MTPSQASSFLAVKPQTSPVGETSVDVLLIEPRLELPSTRATPLDLLVQGLERLLALFVLVVSSPLLLVIAAAIRWDSRGGAIFTQRRIARMDSHALSRDLDQDELPTFTLYKFRTYVVDGERIVPKRSRFEFDPLQVDHVHLQLKDDPRLTRVGRFLRRTSLDEIPNFVNILKGEMRLIGPRPEVPQMYRYYRAEQRLKFSVKPGITGWAQVNGRGKLSFKETVDYDLEYVRKQRSWLGLHILIKTVKVVVLGDGSF